MNHRTAIALCAAVAVSWTGTQAANGFAVSVSFRVPYVSSMQWTYESCINRGKLVRYDISSNSVTRRDTIFPGWAQWPAINLTGTKIAFFRWGKHMENGQIVGTNDPNYVSVVNKDGTGLVDLVPVAAPLSSSASSRDPMLDWPAGDWVYYEKPTKSHEIWRVNINNPASNQLVVAYQKSPKGEDTGPIYFYRWTLSVDAKWALIWTAGYTWNSNIWHCFPPPGGDPLACAPNNGATWAQIWACNGAISPSGSYAAHYTGGVHDNIETLSWDHNTSGSYQTAGSRTYSYAGAEQLRFSANSDKWQQQQVGFEGHADALCNGSNQWLMNWKDGGSIVVSGNTRGASPAQCSDAGDFWIDGGASNAGKYEDVNGAWIAVAPTNAIASRAARGVIKAIAAPHLSCGSRGINVVWGSGKMALRADIRGRMVCGSGARRAY